MNEKKPHITLKLLKIFGWLFLSLAFLLVIARISLKTSLVRHLVKEKAVSIANQQLNGTLSVGSLDGDLCKDFTLRDLAVTQQDTVLTLRSAAFRYNIWDLLNLTFSASSIRLSGLNASVIERESQVFNVHQLVKEQTPAPEDTASSSFGIDIQKLTLDSSQVYVQSSSYLPDSSITVQNLKATAGFSMFEDISASLSSLSFELKEGRLPEPISFETAAAYEDQTITLDKLVIGTGRSLFKANGFAHLKDSSLTAEARTLPFSFKDIQPYLHQKLPDEKLEISLKAGGSADSLHLELQAEGSGFDDLQAMANLSLSGIPTLHKFGIKAQNLDVGYFTHDSVDAHIGQFQATLEGALSNDFSTSAFTWDFNVNQIRYQKYGLQTFFGSGTLKNNKLIASIQLKDGKDEIIAYPEVTALFSETPSWQLPIQFKHINLSHWLEDSGIEGIISLRALAKGTGFELSDDPWTFSLTKPMLPKFVDKANAAKTLTENQKLLVDTVYVSGQAISDFDLQASITKDSLKVNGGVQLVRSKISFKTIFSDFLSTKPRYDFTIQASDFNLSELNGFNQFPTSIQAVAKGDGIYFDPEKIQLNTRLLVDSSYVNGSNFNLLDVQAQLNGNILTIPSGQLVSDIIEGTFSGRRNLDNPTDSDNDFALNMQINNLQPFASLAGAEILKATGNVHGHVTQADSAGLQFTGNIDLYDVQYDTLYFAKSINGTTNISIGQAYSYDVALNISEPAYTRFNLQDIQLTTKGIATSSTAAGNFNLEIDSKEAGTITQAGSYSLDLPSHQTKLTWFTFDFKTPARVLSLQSPFRLTYENSALKTDTLRLRSNGGTYIDLAVPYADSLTQKVWAAGRDFDFGVIQEIIFNERFVDGILSGDFMASRTPQRLSGNGALSISNLAYKNAEVDTLSLNFNLSKQRLKASLSVVTKGEEKIAGKLDIPFIASAPENLSDEFFKEPVEGELIINPVQLNEFEPLLSAFDITRTDGMLSFNSELSGTVETPNFEGAFHLSDPTLSGIKVDTVYARFQYHHLKKELVTKIGIDAKGQNAASIEASLPLSIDFRAQQMNAPEPTDSLSIHLLTDNFNISVFNDFLDRRYLTNLKGFVNADVTITGTTQKIYPKGTLQLDKAEVRVPIAGIKLSDVSSKLNFTEAGLKLNSLKATSGSGSFNANGTIDLDGITPKNLNINAKATHFRLANTSDYNLTIDLNSTITGDPPHPKASGVLTIKNGFIFLQDFGDKSVEDVELESEEISSFSPYDSLAMDMRFVIERNFKIRNRRYLDLDISLTGELDAQKQTGGDLQLFGTLNGEKGYVRPLGKQFTLEDGRFTFSGPIGEPDLYIKASYIPQSTQKEGTPIILYYIIEGSADDPTFRFESEPQMEQQDIICYTLFNKPCYALDSWQQVVSGGGGSSTSNLLVGVLLDQFESLATQELGIDVVEIDNSRAGSNSGTSIKTGWYLSRRTFFAIINEISGSDPKTLFILEYMLNKNWDLIITQGDDSREGVDIRWQYDY